MKDAEDEKLEPTAVTDSEQDVSLPNTTDDGEPSSQQEDLIQCEEQQEMSGLELKHQDSDGQESHDSAEKVATEPQDRDPGSLTTETGVEQQIDRDRDTLQQTELQDSPESQQTAGEGNDDREQTSCEQEMDTAERHCDVTKTDEMEVDMSGSHRQGEGDTAGNSEHEQRIGRPTASRL